MKIRFIARVFGSDKEINPFTIDTENLPTCIGNSVLQLEDFHIIEDAVLTSAMHSNGESRCQICNDKEAIGCFCFDCATSL